MHDYLESEHYRHIAYHVLANTFRFVLFNVDSNFKANMVTLKLRYAYVLSISL